MARRRIPISKIQRLFRLLKRFEQLPEPDTSAFKKRTYQMTLEEFRFFFYPVLIECIELTETNSTIEYILKKTYLERIMEAVRQDKDDIPEDSLQQVAFRLEFRGEVLRYCRRHKIKL